MWILYSTQVVTRRISRAGGDFQTSTRLPEKGNASHPQAHPTPPPLHQPPSPHTHEHFFGGLLIPSGGVRCAEVSWCGGFTGGGGDPGGAGALGARPEPAHPGAEENPQ